MAEGVVGCVVEHLKAGGGELAEERVDQFVADHCRRARDRLPALRSSANTRPPVVTDVTCKNTFDILRRIMRAALELL